MSGEHHVDRLMQRMAGLIPPQNHEGIARYLVYGIRPGSFLEAFFCNDLRTAAARADFGNRLNMANVVQWMEENAPRESWGSPEAFKAWMAKGGLEGN